MSMLTAKDGTQICCGDRGSGQPVVFSPGRPLSADVPSKIAKDATSKIIKGAPHGRRPARKDPVNEELTAFFKA